MKSAIASGLVVFGFVLLALSFAWGSIFPAASKWTPEKEQQATEVKGKLYNLAFIVNAPTPKLRPGQNLGQLRTEYEQLKKESDELNAEFKSAYNSPRTTATALKWTGLGLAIVGLIGVYAVQQAS